MKKIFTIIFTLLNLILLSGCIQIETKVNVNKDGSGTVEETVLMSNEMVQMLNEFITGFSSDTVETEEFKLYSEEDLENRVTELGEGVKLLSSSEYITDDKQGYKVLYSYSDIAKLKIDQSPDSRIPDDASGVEVTEKNFITFSFSEGDVSELKINLPEPEKDEEESGTEEDSVDSDSGDVSELKFLLKDLSFSLVLNFNGEIVETNADYREDSNITLFTLNFGEMLDNPEKLEELKNISPSNIKELKDIMKDIPGIKIETNDPVVVKFH